MPISYGQVNGRRSVAQQPLPSEEDVARARARRWLAARPSCRLCYVVGQSVYGADMMASLAGGKESRDALDAGGVWRLWGERVRRFEREDVGL